ncbi:hypothetical protein [Aeromicrobium marinum]|uniref:hypothetical protein n=1 Tax=Aeromicrobium marinum TaxID=219314 RepID=UPI0001BCD6C9|nr:hypothetical protein [Aeromicrobium marinum]
MTIEYVRVRDTNGEFTTSRANADASGLKVLDKPAVDQIGRPLPAKPHVRPKAPAKKTAASKPRTRRRSESSAAGKNSAAAPATPDGPTATP